MKKLKLLYVLVIAVFLSVNVTGCGKKAPEAGTGSTGSATKSAAVQTNKPITEERTFFDFEGDLQGWEVPVWAKGKADYVCSNISISPEEASKGANSAKLTTDFPGGRWTAALVEIQQYLDLSAYRVLRADVYVPKNAPMGLKANIVLTVGSTWKFVEMNHDIPLIPGEWVTINASIEPGSYDWKRVVPDEEFARDVRKIAVRIVSNRNPTYAGPIYIDNIRVGR